MNKIGYKLMCVLFLVSLVPINGELCICLSPRIKQTKNGPVEGIEETSFFGKKYYAFRGIPYAEAPITGFDPNSGKKVDRRFKPPVPITRKWSEALRVHNYSYSCYPSSTFGPTPKRRSENCLFLNIFVPDGGAEKKTVMVWFHGGAFTEGSGDNTFFGPDFLIDRDNVLVTVNYRLGIFGFLNLGSSTSYTGNMGLKDQQLALKWIYENIEYFSGNKSEILLFGESAGGASVSYQMLNEESRKYFQRAALLSSTSLNYYALDEPNHLERIRKCLNLHNKTQIIRYLKTTATRTLSKCEGVDNFGKILLDSRWVPTIEDPKTEGAFITKHPEEIYRSDNAPAMDVLFSFNSEEFNLFNPDLTRNTEPFLSGDKKNSILLLPFDGFDKETYPKEYQQAIDLLKRAYFNDTSNVDAIKYGNIGLLSDLNFGYGILKTVQYQIIANTRAKKNTFLQRFTVNTESNVVKFLMHLNYNGAAHLDEVCYMFRCDFLDSFKIYVNYLGKDSSDKNYNIVMTMVNIMTNFARTGDPSIEGNLEFKSSTSPDQIFTQVITNELKTHTVTDIMEQLHFKTWKEIENIYKILKYHRKIALIRNSIIRMGTPSL